MAIYQSVAGASTNAGERHPVCAIFGAAATLLLLAQPLVDPAPFMSTQRSFTTAEQ